MEPPPRPPTSLRRATAEPHDPTDPAWKSVELAQRGRMILDVATADLEAAEALLGPFHETSWHFRRARDEARRSWDRLRARYGGAALEAALAEPPRTVLKLDPDAPGGPRAILIPIAGKTYRAERVPGTPVAPAIWRLSRLPALEQGPYYVCRLGDGSTQCDCAEWTFRDEAAAAGLGCKHLAALAALGWM